MGQEFAEKFQLEYWRDEVGKWISYKDHLGRTVSCMNWYVYRGNFYREPRLVYGETRILGKMRLNQL